MLRSMFARLMAVMMAAVLVCVFALFTVSYVTQRSNYIQARMDELKVQAYDIAYLASRIRNNAIIASLGYNDATQGYIQWKANEIYRQFNAYCVVVDRTGQTTLYAKPEQLREEQIIINEKQIFETLGRVLRGEEIVYRTDGAEGPMFTIAVPWSDNGNVLGAVLVKTEAQTVYASYQGLALKAFSLAAAIMLLAGVCVFFITRAIVRPLRVMAQLSGELAQGHFSNRVPVSGSSETRELAASFNLMAEQLDALEKMRRDFVANVSHELRSPMTSIQGFLQGMLDGTIPPADNAKYMQIVLDETRRLNKLVGNLLNLSRMESSETALSYSDFDLHESIRRILIANMSQLDEKQLELSLSFEDTPMYVHADADQIAQVLINLLSNAIKYTPKGGQIAIDTVQNSAVTRVTVRDNGEGVAPEDVPFIFDRFYKADKAHTVGKGTGLGLSICKRIMEKHHQELRLLPTSCGAAFEFTLESGHAPENMRTEESYADQSTR